MQLFDRLPSIDFMGPRRIAVAISAVAILISIASLATRGLELGLDFTGGVLIELRYDAPADLEGIRGQLEAGGYDGAIVQNFGSATGVLVRLPPQLAALADGESESEGEERDAADVSVDVVEVLRAADPNVERMRAETVTPQVGEELAPDPEAAARQRDGGLPLALDLLQNRVQSHAARDLVQVETTVFEAFNPAALVQRKRQAVGQDDIGGGKGHTALQ